MAILKSARVVGLAGNKRSRTITFNRHVNVIWGLNGSGKTTFLKILHSALLDDNETLKELPFRETKVTFTTSRNVTVERVAARSTSANKQKDLEPETEERSEDSDLYTLISHESVRDLNADEVLRVLQEKLERGTTGWRTVASKPLPQIRRFHHRYLPTARAMSGDHTRRTTARPINYARDHYDERDLDRFFARVIQDLWASHYRDQLMEISRIQENGIARILNIVISHNLGSQQTHDDTKDAERAFEAVSSFFNSRNIFMESSRSDFESNYQKQGILRRVVDEIIAVENQEAEARKSGRKLEELLNRLLSGNKRVSLDAHKISVLANEEEIPIASLSSGEKQLLYILFETLRAKKDLIIIDEPELSMHVDWQRDLIESMRAVNPDAQIVIATHSPEILASVSEEDIIAL